MAKKIKNTELKRSKWYYRYKTNGTSQYVSLQLDSTATPLKIQTRRDSIHNYIPFIKTGEMTKSELLSNLSWYQTESNTPATSLKYWSSEFIKVKESENLEDKTIDRLKNTFNHFKDSDTIHGFNNKFIIAFVEDRKKVVKHKTINVDLTNIKQLANYLQGEGLIKQMPKIKKIKVTDNDANKRITEYQYNLLINDAELDEISKICVRLYYNCGMRANELFLGELVDNRLIIAADVEKNNKHKVIDVPSWAVELVLKVQEDKRNCNHNRRNRYRDVISVRIRNSMKRCGFYEKNKTKPIHSLRHAFLSRMYLITGSMSHVSELIGHSNSKVTLGYVTDIKQLMIDYPSDVEFSIFKDNIDRMKLVHDRVAQSLKTGKGLTKRVNRIGFHEKEQVDC